MAIVAPIAAAIAFAGDCDNVTFYDPIMDNHVPLKFARLGLQGYARSFEPSQYLYRERLARAVQVAERLFSGSIQDAKLVRQQCLFGVACLEVLCLLMMRETQAWQLLTRIPAVTGALSHTLDGSGDWGEGSKSWPLFGMLAMLAERVVPGALRKEATLPFDTSWDAWLDSNDWDAPEELQRLAVAELQGGGGGPCSPRLAAAAATIAAAQGGPLARERGLQAAGHHIKHCLETGGITDLLTPEWVPVWHGFDRLSTLQSIEVQDGGADKGSFMPVSYQLSLLPPHVLGANLSDNTFWFLGDRIRAFRTSHCNPLFRVALEKIAAHRILGSNLLTAWDVGAHLGDCCLWAAARFGKDNVKCVAFERDAGAAQAIRRSVVENGFQDVVEVREGAVGGPRKRCPEPHIRAFMPLDCSLSRETLPYIDFVHFHIGGGYEMKMLEGFVKSLRAKRVGAALVRATVLTPEDLGDFVLKHQLPYQVVPLRENHDVILLLDDLQSWDF